MNESCSIESDCRLRTIFDKNRSNVRIGQYIESDFQYHLIMFQFGMNNGFVIVDFFKKMPKKSKFQFTQ